MMMMMMAVKIRLLLWLTCLLIRARGYHPPSWLKSRRLDVSMSSKFWRRRCVGVENNTHEKVASDASSSSLTARERKDDPGTPRSRRHLLKPPGRRQWLQELAQDGIQMVTVMTTARFFLPALASGSVVGSFSWPTSSAAVTTETAELGQLSSAELVASIHKAADTLHILLDRWEQAVIDCTYADVPRELLETKNKQELLEKASVFALFDKSVSVVSCKTSNRIVRDYLGRTGQGPLVGLDKKLRRAMALVVDETRLDDYVASLEAVQEALTKADSFSYAAGVADLSAVNNFNRQDQDIRAALSNDNSNLGQARQEIESAVQELRRMLALLPPPSTTPKS